MPKELHADALEFFGATGDLGYKLIFPAFQSMVKRGNLHVPVIGVAKSNWDVNRLRAGLCRRGLENCRHGAKGRHSTLQI
jgi:glucose-6-phosphate 1-dehydrogenase